MRLQILTSTFPRWPGDATTPFVRQFAEALAARGTDVEVVAPHFAGAATWELLGPRLRVRRFRYFWPAAQEDIAYGGNAVSRVSGHPVYLLKLGCFVLAALVRVAFGRARVVNAHWLIPQGFVAVLAGLLARKRVVVTVHGGDVFSLNRGLMRRIKRVVLRRADAVVVNSSATRDACHDLYPDRRYEVIPMGVDTDRFSPGPPSAQLVQRFGLGDFTVLFVGRLTDDKGVRYLVEALTAFRQTGARFRALIVGSGDLEVELKQYVVDGGLEEEVIFPGWVASEDLVDYYRTADVFVGPSIVGERGWQEALGLVFVEALATGLPVVTTRTGGIGDVVEDGVTGFMVEQRSPDQIAERLRALYDDRNLLERMSRTGRAVVEQRFSWTLVADRYERVFASVGRPSRPGTGGRPAAG